jgi:putative sigma-54 modulation protein
MNTQIRTKDITLTDHTKAHVDAAIENFTKFGLELTTVNTIIKKEKQGVNVEFDIHIAHNAPVVINQSDDVLDAAIDLAIDRANKALRRLHDKNVTHRGTESIKNLEVEGDEIVEEAAV